jgi:glycosyltransferase involved in cell wall biosynthesis
LSDDVSIALAYAAVDVTVVPSLQENLPNTVMESMACGTPCVAFRIGGIPDLIDHLANGFLAEPYRAEVLADGIRWVLGDEERRAALAAAGRQKIEAAFSLEVMTKGYVRLYEELLTKRRPLSG